MKKLIFLLIIILSVSFLIADPPNWTQLQGTQYSMVVMADITLYDQPFVNTGNNMAAAFGPGGEDDCRAVATWQDANPPYYDGFWFFTIVANINGELITFKIYNEATDNIYTCDGSIVFQNNTTIGSPSEPYQLSVGTSSLSGTVYLETISPPEGNVQEVSVDVAGLTVHPDASGFYSVQLNTGLYDVSFTLDNYLTTVIKNVQINSGAPTENVNAHLIDWNPIGGTQYSMVVMTTAIFNGDEITDNSSYHIAAFGSGGDDDCRGIAYWQPPNPPYWNGYWYITIVGNEQNEQISFKMFNERTGEITDCYQTVTFIDNSTIGSASEPWQISNGVLRNYNFEQGWNWISFNIIPDDYSLDTFFAPVTGIYQVKNQYHSATYFSQQDAWVGDLTEIDLTKTYLIFMLNNYNNFSLIGVPFDPTTPIQLNTGWNWVSYLPQDQRDLDTALQSVENNVSQIKSQNHSATYYNPPGNWVGDLEVMYPGQGYKIKVSNDDVLYYDNPGKVETTAKVKDNQKDAPNWQVITGTEYSMVLMATVTKDNQPFTGENNQNIVAAFGPGGEDDCRSIATWQPATENWDGYWYFTIVGDNENEEISFKIYDAEDDQVYDCQETLEFQINQTIGNPFEPFEITATGNSASENQIEDAQINLFSYPNPFILSASKLEGIKINYTIPKNQTGTITIYNIKGQKVKRFTNLRNSSDHNIIWLLDDESGKRVSSGVYLYKLQTKEKSKIKKLIILR